MRGRLGIGWVVVERRSRTSVLPRATGINVHSMEIFRGLGSEEPIREVSLAGDGVTFLMVGEALCGYPHVTARRLRRLTPLGWGTGDPASAPAGGGSLSLFEWALLGRGEGGTYGRQRRTKPEIRKRVGLGRTA